MQNIGYEVVVDGQGGRTEPVKNDSVGDGEDKRPHVEGLYRNKVVIRGEVKTEEDIDSEDAITKYKLFTSEGYLIVGIPKGLRDKAIKVMEDNLTEDSLDNLEIGEY